MHLTDVVLLNPTRNTSALRQRTKIVHNLHKHTCLHTVLGSHYTILSGVFEPTKPDVHFRSWNTKYSALRCLMIWFPWQSHSGCIPDELCCLEHHSCSKGQFVCPTGEVTIGNILGPNSFSWSSVSFRCVAGQVQMEVMCIKCVDYDLFKTRRPIGNPNRITSRPGLVISSNREKS